MAAVQHWRLLFLLAIGPGACHLVLPLGPGDEPCDNSHEGECHPNHSGHVCFNGEWILPPCKDSIYGCGDPGGSSSTGYCDRGWSDCVGGSVDITNCEKYCDSVGQRCCDKEKQATGDCEPHEQCKTARGRYKAYGGGGESWKELSQCENPTVTMEVGQQTCAGTLTDGSPVAWTDDERRYRCCCFPK